jgi:hypothetical protein
MQTEQEKLNTAEILPQQEQAPPAANESLSADALATLFQARRNDLAAIKKWVGLKFFYRATEKVKQEEASLKRLLRLETAKQTILADYSFVLDPAYFEQKFLT